MPIHACATCFSDRLQFPKSGTTFTCNDCGWQGEPRQYSSWSAWQEAKGKAPKLEMA
jgi:hypothetical protein